VPARDCTSGGPIENGRVLQLTFAHSSSGSHDNERPTRRRPRCRVLGPRTKGRGRPSLVISGAADLSRRSGNPGLTRLTSALLVEALARDRRWP